MLGVSDWTTGHMNNIKCSELPTLHVCCIKFQIDFLPYQGYAKTLFITVN